MMHPDDMTVDLSASPKGSGFARLTFKNVGSERRFVDRRMACMMGFTPKGVFLFKAPTRFVGRRVTCFGNDPSFYESLEPGESFTVDADLRMHEGLSGPCDVIYDAHHGDPEGTMVLRLRSTAAKIDF